MSKTTKKTIAHKTTKRLTTKLDPRIARVHALIDEWTLPEDKEGNYRDGNYSDAMKQLLDAAMPGSMSGQRLKDLFTLIMSDDTIDPDHEVDEKRRNEIAKVATLEHNLYCACCRARAEVAA